MTDLRRAYRPPNQLLEQGIGNEVHLPHRLLSGATPVPRNLIACELRLFACRTGCGSENRRPRTYSLVPCSYQALQPWTPQVR